MQPDLPQKRNIDHRKAVMAGILCQALTISDWEEHCAELIKAHEVSFDEVKAAARTRANLLTTAPIGLSMLLWTATVIWGTTFSTMSHPLSSEFVIAGLCIVAHITIVAYLYYFILITLQKSRIYCDEHLAILLTTLLMSPLMYLAEIQYIHTLPLTHPLVVLLLVVAGAFPLNAVIFFAVRCYVINQLSEVHSSPTEGTISKHTNYESSKVPVQRFES